MTGLLDIAPENPVLVVLVRLQEAVQLLVLQLSRLGGCAHLAFLFLFRPLSFNNL